MHSSFSMILIDSQTRLSEKLPPPCNVWEEPTTVFVDTLPVSLNTCEKNELINSLKDIYKHLDYRNFRTFIYNFVIGNQVVIKCNDKSIVESIVNVLKDILPRLCMNVSIDKNVYEHIWAYNVVGLKSDLKLPDDLDMNTICVLEISFDNEGTLKMQSKYGEQECLRNKQPFESFVNGIMKIIEQDKEYNNSCSSYKITRLKLTALKEEWTW